MIDLWEELHELFDTDDGSLPDICVENLAGDQVCKIYRWVRSECGIYCENGDPTFWDRINECDVPIKSVDDPAHLVVTGRFESFRHGLISVQRQGIDIPQLTIAVFPDEIEFDYRMGPEWGPTQLNALFDFLWEIQKMASNSKITHAHEGLEDKSPSFTETWLAFRREKRVAPE